MKKTSKYLNSDYLQLKSKMFFQFIGMIIISFVIILSIYLLVWRGNGADWLVSVFQQILQIDYYSALDIYQRFFRDNVGLIIVGLISFVFLVLLIFFLNWFIRYFNAINDGIESLLHDEEEKILLPSEMLAIEKKLNTVKQTLKQRATDIQLAEQRKNDLVMYLAHDIRTPLTSVIGYLNLLDEAPDMPMEQKAKYVSITLEKAYGLEKMINEFFEITRYNLQQIVLSKETIDLYYMLIQITDEMSPILAEKGNTVIINAEEDINVYGDSDKLARVLNNLLKNAAAYSYPNTEIIITAVNQDNSITLSFKNKGKTISENKLSSIFEKFYRLDEARSSETGGSGLGLAIAKEIVTLHGGTISAKSEDDSIEFIIVLPLRP